MKTRNSIAGTTNPKTMAGRLRTACATRLLPIVLLLALPALAQARFAFTTNNGTITITAYIGSANAVIIPDTITGLPVTSIGDSAFANNSNLTSVTIGTNVTSIGFFAFSSCTNLTSIAIPNSVTSIAEGAFSDCRSLTNITIPGSVTSIGSYAFQECTSLTAITVDTNNLAYSSVTGVLFDKNQTTLIQYPAGIAGSYTIPDSVTSIGSNAFFYCTNLTNVTIPGSVTSIEDSAFADCESLTTITIPNSVTNLGDIAFAYSALTTVAIPTGVTSVGNAFAGCSALTSVTIPNSVTGIGEFAFDHCTALTSVTIPNSVTYIGDYAFNACFSLTNATLGNSVNWIGSYAFGDSPLNSVTIPSSVTYIASWAFRDSLREVYFQGNAPDLDQYAFGQLNPFGPPSYPTAYYLPGTTGWNTFALPTALWVLPNPLILTGASGVGLGVQTNGFGFIISWATNLPVVVEASTNLANPIWSPVATNTLTGGSSYFSDPRWTNYPSRFYRIRSE